MQVDRIGRASCRENRPRKAVAEEERIRVLGPEHRDRFVDYGLIKCDRLTDSTCLKVVEGEIVTYLAAC